MTAISHKIISIKFEVNLILKTTQEVRNDNPKGKTSNNPKQF